eukprot:TRINITY_DN50376_c0_g1_i1.p2 TRINITY_DN50376_c0_g1~~TRINITY_DN50376_c0_g1_i1.p2  ORF type:complete len:334 (+),score=58.25 TRINITY_DN50376_c0_g1_i1:68-1069(+)
MRAAEPLSPLQELQLLSPTLSASENEAAAGDSWEPAPRRGGRGAGWGSPRAPPGEDAAAFGDDFCWELDLPSSFSVTAWPQPQQAPPARRGGAPALRRAQVEELCARLSAPTQAAAADPPEPRFPFQPVLSDASADMAGRQRRSRCGIVERLQGDAARRTQPRAQRKCGPFAPQLGGATLEILGRTRRPDPTRVWARLAEEPIGKFRRPEAHEARRRAAAPTFRPSTRPHPRQPGAGAVWDRLCPRELDLGTWRRCPPGRDAGCQASGPGELVVEYAAGESGFRVVTTPSPARARSSSPPSPSAWDSARRSPSAAHRPSPDVVRACCLRHLLV